MLKFLSSAFSKLTSTSDKLPTPPPVASSSGSSCNKDCAGFQLFSCVSTVYGVGYITQVRPDCFVVRLTHWKLAQGQSPTLYLQKEAMTLIPGALVGSTVSTPYGTGTVESIRPDGTHVVRPLNWKLANGCIATLYLQPEQVKLTQTAGIQEGDEVMTVYGRGFVIKKRLEKGDVVVLLRHWKLAQGQSPTCYLEPSACTKIHRFEIGAMAKTCWGIVQITDIRRNGTYVCTAMHWKLADGKAPTMYLAPEAFALCSLKP